MEYSQLGNTDLRVSKICLGTMTFGEQNSESEAHQQLDFALDEGVNFIDTAEMYPVPPRQETQGLTESYIGTWLKKNKKRDKLVIASKVAGPGMMDYLRNGVELVRGQMQQALDDSLRRLNTDYLDLYQIHWPARKTNFFGQLGYQFDETESTPIEETLGVLNDFVQSGKVRHIGISNETPWGAMQYLMLAKEKNWPRIVSIQNPYSLLNRSYEVGLAEFSQQEKLGLLAYSPLGFGVLTGKYIESKNIEKARLTLYEKYTRYSNDQAQAATQQYVALAKRHNISPAQMALAYVNTRPFVAGNIIGATNLDQLKENIASIELVLSEEVLEEIESIHQSIPNPSP